MLVIYDGSKEDQVAILTKILNVIDEHKIIVAGSNIKLDTQNAIKKHNITSQKFLLENIFSQNIFILDEQQKVRRFSEKQFICNIFEQDKKLMCKVDNVTLPFNEIVINKKLGEFDFRVPKLLIATNSNEINENDIAPFMKNENNILAAIINSSTPEKVKSYFDILIDEKDKEITEFLNIYFANAIKEYKNEHSNNITNVMFDRNYYISLENVVEHLNFLKKYEYITYLRKTEIKKTTITLICENKTKYENTLNESTIFDVKYIETNNITSTNIDTQYVVIANEDTKYNLKSLEEMVLHAQFHNSMVVVAKKYECFLDKEIKKVVCENLFSQSFIKYDSNENEKLVYDNTLCNKLINTKLLKSINGFNILDNYYINKELRKNKIDYLNVNMVKSYDLLFEEKIIDYSIKFFEMCEDDILLLNFLSVLMSNILSFENKNKIFDVVKKFANENNEYLVHIKQSLFLEEASEEVLNYKKIFSSYKHLYEESNYPVEDILLACNDSNFDNKITEINNLIKCEKNVFIVVTPYMLMTSILHAIRSDKPSIIYISTTYVKFSEELVEKIKETNVFLKVKTFTHHNTNNTLVNKLKVEYNDGEYIIPAILNSYYEPIFYETNRDDRICYFKGTPSFYYYFEKHYNHLVKMEDGYGSFKNELDIKSQLGEKGLVLLKHIPTNYPDSDDFANPKIREIIINKEVEKLPSILANKTKVIDFNELVKQAKGKFEKTIMEIYGVEKAKTQYDVLILTQPLYRFGYCTVSQQKEFYKMLFKQYKGKKVVVKKHPADNLKYKGINQKMYLVQDVPMEVYTYAGYNFDEVVTLFSKALDNVEAKKKISLCDPDEVTRKGIQNYINQSLAQYYKNAKIYEKVYRKAKRETKKKLKKILKR